MEYSKVARLFISILLFTLGFSVLAVEPEERPVWELGVGGGAVYSPMYPASNENRARALALPYGVYRGDFLRVGDGGFIRGILLDQEDVEFDFSFNAAFNANSIDNKARQGMPDLDYLFEFGPSMTFGVYEDDRSRIEARLPLRMVISTDFKNINQRGYVFNPQLRYERQKVFGSNTKIFSNLGANFATEKLHHYFYSVDNQYANSERPAYRASGGYLGTEFSIGLSYLAAEDLRFVWGARYSDYHGAQNDDSPLFTANSTMSYFFAFTWRLAQSEETIKTKSIQ